MKAIAEKLGRSTRTPHEHIQSHNKKVEKNGGCPTCKRVGSSCFNKKAKRKKILN